MVFRQHVGMESAVPALQGVAQPAKVGVAILVIEQTGAAIVSTLHDMQRYTVDPDAPTSGHGCRLAEIGPGPFLLTGSLTGATNLVGSSKDKAREEQPVCGH